ncbi:MAG TPA: LPS export ABC transporter periplasmic protein LptC [Candidatus Acidoferrales bacterium]|nr:LPS export ABC transporter periplasmic protein LptC [Candidatus Acidoferrales bacterium]
MAWLKLKGMSNRDAARYARWSAGIAIAICMAVLGVYLQRRWRERANEKGLQPVPATVAQQSTGFEISRAIGPRTIFTVRASQATQFKDENRSLLENVVITIFGPRGDRNDSVHANECSYEPETGSIRCQGVVQIDLRSAKNTPQRAELQLETSNILFERDSNVSTNSVVSLKFPGGEGSGTGLVYAPQSENVALQKDVQLDLAPPQDSRRAPVHITSNSLEFRRSQDVLRLEGPVRVQQDSQTLTAGILELQLDAAMRPSHVVATENPELTGRSSRGNLSLAADRMSVDLSPNGTLRKLSADDRVRGEAHGRDGTDDVSAQHVQVVMDSSGAQSEPREFLAQGKVRVETDRSKSQGRLATESLRTELRPSKVGHGLGIASTETLAPGRLTLVKPIESVDTTGGKLSALFGAQDEITELNGTSGVTVERTAQGKLVENSSAQSLSAKFSPDGNWQTIDENGNVKFQQGDKSGAAANAQLVSASNQLTLSGSASVQDSSSHLQATKIQLNQATDEVHASGNVVASFSGQKGKSSANPPTGSAQIAADEMDGTSAGKSGSADSSNAGHAIFSGHARMWQGSDVLQARTIEFWQDEQRAEARGSVFGEFVEAPHRNTGNGKRQATSAPVLWQVHAQKVDYWSDAGKMEWSNGVDARSSDGEIQSQNVQMFFSRAENNQQALERAVGTGNVRIEQNGRTGTADRGEYIARDGKFVLSGGQPSLTDAAGNTTTGHKLTFFLANDSILVDSQRTSETKTEQP